MEQLATLLSSLAALAWPIVLAAVLFVLIGPIKKLIESAQGRRFTLKVAGNELTMEEASEQQRRIVSDLQSAVAELEKRVLAKTAEADAIPQKPVPDRIERRILWVDDHPKNNSYLVALLQERGATVDIALDTDEAMDRFQVRPYDIVLSDMGRPEGGKAGIDLAKKIRQLDSKVPFFIFCSFRAAHALRSEALSAGVTGITSSGTALLSQLPLGDHPYRA